MSDFEDPRDSNPLLDLSSSRRGGRSPVAVCAFHEEFMRDIRLEFSQLKDDLLETRKEGRQTREESSALRGEFGTLRTIITKLQTGKKLTDDDLTPPGRNSSQSPPIEVSVGTTRARGNYRALVFVGVVVLGGIGMLSTAWVMGARAGHVTATVKTQ